MNEDYSVEKYILREALELLELLEKDDKILSADKKRELLHKVGLRVGAVETFLFVAEYKSAQA